MDPENLAPNAPNLERGGKILPEEFAGVDWGNFFGGGRDGVGGSELEARGGGSFSGEAKKKVFSPLQKAGRAP